MKRPTLVTADSADLRVRFARRTLEAWKGRAEVRVLTPARGAGDDLVRGLDLAKGRWGLGRHTPLQLALELATAELARRQIAPVSGVALDALTIAAIHRAVRGGRLRYFEHVCDTVGFTSALQRTLSELRMDMLGPDDVHDSDPATGDLRTLIECFQQELAEGRLADPAMIYQAASHCLDDGPSRKRSGSVLLLDSVPDSRAEAQFVAALGRRSIETVAVVAPGDIRGMRFLEEALDRKPELLDPEPARRTLDQVRSFIFSPQTPERRPADASLTFFSSTDEGRECAEIARHIHSAAGRNTRFDDIAILLREPESYQPLVEEALTRAGIPAYFTRASRRPNPAGRAFLSLLACRAENLSASRFAEYLSLGQVPNRRATGTREPPARWVPAEGELFAEAPRLPESHSDPIAGENTDHPLVVGGGLVAPHHWEQLLVDASVVAGQDRWEVRLQGMSEELHEKIRAVEDEDESRREHLERQFVGLQELRAFALPVIGMLAALPEEALWAEWLGQLETLAASTLRHADAVLAVLGELRPMARIGPVGLEDVERVLTERLDFLRSEPPQRRYGRVFVSSIAEAAGRTFSLVFIPGLSEGLFPKKSSEDPLLSDARRREISVGLRTNEDRIRQERSLLRLALGCARDRLYVSYPRMDLAQARSRVPSFYALDILRAGEGEIPDLPELEQRAVESSRSRLGWPSPLSPSDAIDDAEYDLATIGGLMHQVPAAVRGQAHYLVDTHPVLARSLRSRARRWRNFWSSSDGLVDPSSDTLRLLDSFSLRTRAYSPTALEQFAICPYRFFLRAIHRLYPRSEIVRFEQLDPLARGLIFHAVQFRLLSELRGNLLPVTPDNVDDVTRVADRVLDETATEYAQRWAPAIPRIWDTALEDLRADLRGWLRAESERNLADPGWIPVQFEFAFGLEHEPAARDPTSSPTPALLPGGYRLRGAVDLIEEHVGTSLVRIVDHKTGRFPASTPQPTGHGETLQPLLYAMAVEALTGRTVSLSRLSFCTNGGDFQSVDIPVDDGTRQAASDMLDGINEMIVEGFLPAAPRAGACATCDYRIVCGPYEELRTSRKKQERLGRLLEIRQTP